MKKIFGYTLLVIGGFIGLSLVIQLPQAIEDLTDKSKIEASDPDSFIVGVIIGGFIVCVITFSMLWFGFKLIQKPDTEQIEDSEQK
jgi:hypothetical protein